MNKATRDLALEIARCPVIAAVLRGDQSPCHDVVNYQKRPLSERWLAEPWSGHLELAPILFVSSNPSSGDAEAAPDPNDLTTSSDDEAILHTFDDVFEPGPWSGIAAGTHLRAADGKAGDYVAYWGSCKARASEVLGRPALPGVDYALTEAVHCGSRHEIGVWGAAAECVPRYLYRLLSLSPAVLVVVVGAVARDVVHSMVPDLGARSHLVGPLAWAGRQRYALFLPHPNARRVLKGVAPYLGESAGSNLISIRAAIARAGANPLETSASC